VKEVDQEGEEEVNPKDEKEAEPLRNDLAENEAWHEDS